MSDKLTPTHKPKLLIVEDDEGLKSQYKWSFDDYDLVFASDRNQALKAMEKHRPKVVTLDLGLPPDPDGVSEGFAVLELILAYYPYTKIIVASGHQAHQSAVDAISQGAYDFYQKPIDQEQLKFIIRRAYHVAQLEEENRKLLEEGRGDKFSRIITNSTAMHKVCTMIERVAAANVTVMLLGASGTGKELLARALHDNSARKDRKFVAINCAAIPENLLESELFGYEKGAFTGAVKQTIGKIELAEGGTLFLDEIGDLPFPLQVKLLRFLQERVIERIGGRKEIAVDVRVVCATHQNVETLIAQGDFREDLYYRLSEIVINIPPLFEREGDSVLLAKVFLEQFAREMNRTIKGFSKEALMAISAYKWPGNVRELENRVKRAVIMAEGNKVSADDLELEVDENYEETLNLRKIREKADIKAIKMAISNAEGNVSQAARLLGVSRPTFYGLIKQYELNI